jgi:peptidoglycan/LPS O-acetylase OafA/YrhL
MRVRNHALDGLRGLAALGVLTLHVWMFTVQGAHGRDELVSLLTGELRLGVVLFFVLSGYLLAGPWVASALEDRPKPRLGRFAAKRAARIVPAYWAAMSAPSGCWPAAGTTTRSARGSCRCSPPSGRTTSHPPPAGSTPRCGRWWSR